MTTVGLTFEKNLSYYKSNLRRNKWKENNGLDFLPWYHKAPFIESLINGWIIALYNTEFRLGLLSSPSSWGSMPHKSNGSCGIHASTIVPPQLDSISPKTWIHHKFIRILDQFLWVILDFKKTTTFFLASSPWKSVTNYVIEWMRLNSDVFPGFQQIPCYA